MARTALSREGDVVDRIALAAYGRTAGATEAVLDANPHLSTIGPVLPAGVTVALPDLLLATVSAPALVKLWD